MLCAHPYVSRIKQVQPFRRVGFVRRVFSGHIESTGPLCAIGDLCEIAPGTDQSVFAEVVSVEYEHIVLVPFDATKTILPDTHVIACDIENKLPVGDQYAGRAIDALGAPIDGHGDIIPSDMWPSAGRVLMPLERTETKSILPTGLRAIDGLLPIAAGQRMGIFAASGVGKTTLVKQLVSNIECDRCVICLVGERGQEVEAFWSEFGDDPKFSCVSATSDQSASLRARAVNQALGICEYWREQGQHILLIIDSVTRYAMALREIGLSAGAPPTLRAYTPNVFSALPRLVERCGARKAGGSITALMTILSETDDVDDPIVEVMKSLLDGHIILSRALAEQGHFPAIDTVKSVSRRSEELVGEAHAQSSRQVLAWQSAYEDAQVMIESGIYKSGANPQLDVAIDLRPQILEFLKQERTDNSPLEAILAALEALSAGGGAHA